MQTNNFSVFSHIKKQHDKVPCTICGEMIGKYIMNRHIEYKHKDSSSRKHKCSFCGKGFVSGKELKDHINTHTGAKPYMCNFCGAAFASHGTWRMHERTVHLGHKRDESSHNKSGGKDLTNWQNSKQPVNFMVFKDEKKS